MRAVLAALASHFFFAQVPSALRGNGRTERRHGVHVPIRLRYVGDVEVWCVHPQVSKRTTRDCAAERCCQDKASQDKSEKHAQEFACQSEGQRQER